MEFYPPISIGKLQNPFTLRRKRSVQEKVRFVSRVKRGNPEIRSQLLLFSLLREKRGLLLLPLGFFLQPAVSTIDLGETAAFQCSPEKNVVATISWSKEEGSLPTGRYSIVKGGLYIRNATVGDNGMYVCTIRTDQGTAQASVTLNVNGKVLFTLSS